jgi:5-(carboxyamino)imidazole ribonucleotide synthase
MKQSGTIGIVGGGQLGQMLTQAALPLGFQVIVLDPQDNSPAAQVGASQIVRNYDARAISELADQVDFLTTEFEEGLDVNILKSISEKGIAVNPAPNTIALILDKSTQKNYLSKAGIAMGSYAEIKTADDAVKLLDKYNGKMVIKTRTGGYDGYGNRVVVNKEQIAQAFEDFKNRLLYAEAFIEFKKELAVMAVRNKDGEIITYPVVETIQKNNICHEVRAPADINESVKADALAIAKKVTEQFAGAGAFGIEMFLTADNEIWLNEVAPRVHNSGHYTIEACNTSQFEQHIRAVTAMPLTKADMKVPSAVMINILGERNGPVNLKGVEEAESDPNTFVHIYGKSPTKIGRKMGHVTATGDSLDEAKRRAEKARQLISI